MSLQEKGEGDLRGIRKTGTDQVKMEQTMEQCSHELRTPGPQRLQEAGRRLWEALGPVNILEL